jgi:hypothetical protein
LSVAARSPVSRTVTSRRRTSRNREAAPNRAEAITRGRARPVRPSNSRAEQRGRVEPAADRVAAGGADRDPAGGHRAGDRAKEEGCDHRGGGEAGAEVGPAQQGVGGNPDPGHGEQDVGEGHRRPTPRPPLRLRPPWSCDLLLDHVGLRRASRRSTYTVATVISVYTTSSTCLQRDHRRDPGLRRRPQEPDRARQVTSAPPGEREPAGQHEQGRDLDRIAQLPIDLDPSQVERRPRSVSNTPSIAASLTGWLSATKWAAQSPTPICTGVSSAAKQNGSRNPAGGLGPGGRVEHRRPRINVGHLAVDQVEPSRLVHPGVGGDHEECPRDPGDHDRDPAQQVGPGRQPVPGVRVDAEEDRLGEERDPLDGKRQAGVPPDEPAQRLARRQDFDPQARPRQRGSSVEMPCRDAVVDNEPLEGVHTRGVTDLLDRSAQRP